MTAEQLSAIPLSAEVLSRTPPEAIDLEERGVSPTNNHAERTLRYAVLWRKRSFGMRVEKADRIRRTYPQCAPDLPLQGKRVYPVLVDAMRAFMHGTEPDLAWIHDCVLRTEVLEHVPNPGEVLREIRRILKPGHRIFLTTPFMWSEHEQPYDFQRFTSLGLRRLFEECGYAVRIQEKLGKGPIASAQLFTAWLLNTILRPVFPRPYLGVLAMAVVIAPIHGLALLLERLARGNEYTEEWYLDNLVIAEKCSMPER